MASSARLWMDRRGAVALEAVMVMSTIGFALFWPIADIGVAGAKYISTLQALRNYGAYLQYHVPLDVSQAAYAVSVSGHSVTVQTLCGDPPGVACAANSTVTPKYYSLSTTISFSPIVLQSVFGGSHPVVYFQRFQ